MATVFTPSIATRPTYGTLQPPCGAPLLCVADGAGGAALLALSEHMPGCLEQAHILFIPQDSPDGPKLAALPCRSYGEAPDLAAALPRLDRLLAQASIATRLCLAGSEGLIGRVSARALGAGIAAEMIQTEHRGHIARAVQCVHCKGVTEDVLTDPFICAHCGLALFVRDHFSRRLGVFQGVCVDAETPGQRPDPQEIRP
ncbi:MULTISPECIES: dimethylamine monooxygenase subunit DmmA family protein [Thioclava]|uniref:Dimethylamine monooxygenase subunit DmmA family protein n=1 Tax=Thioclava litoralis TaxID=3076557 RepID=A0ABZ1E258_9RHOB|nr:dimethylamine monooxygenase subunit DmmA family protein [Thioclava sp. FTW29]